MPTIPKIQVLSNNSVDVINAIRNGATQEYRDYVPKATPNADSIREIGAIIMDSPSLQNQFLSALVNRIARVVITSKMFDNPLKMFKKGLLEFGETVEEIFVEIAKPYEFNPSDAETTVFKREIPNVKSAFHVMNYTKFYKVTIQNDQLRTAFLSWQGITDLIAKIVDSMYSGASYDEFLVMKYLLAKHILNGQLTPVKIPNVNADNMKSIVSSIKGSSNNLEFPSNKYNIAGVKTQSSKQEQYILVNAFFDAVMDVEVLASAFNMEKAEFIGNRVLVDSFGALDTERLAELFDGDSSYTELTTEQLSALNEIPAVLLDRDFFMIFDNYYNFTEQYNGQGLYWNYWYHTWKTFSISPYANNIIFVTGTPVVASVVVSPNTLTMSKGQSAYFIAQVETEYFASKVVNWSVNSEKSKIDSSGKLFVASDEDKTTLTVTATSKFDGTKKGIATVTVV